MATRNDDLIAKRKASLASKSKSVPTADPPGSFGDGGGYVATRSDGSAGAGISLPMVEEVDLTREITADDLVMPKLKICQAMSKVSRSGIPQGHYYHSTLESDLGKTIRVIPVDMRKSRGKFTPGIGLTCRSFDMIQGEGDPGILCEGTPEERRTLPANQRGCKFRLWGDRDPVTKRSSPPLCPVGYNFPVLILDADDPDDGPTKRAIISFRGTGAQVAKAITSMITEQDLLWNESVIELGTEERTNSKGTFFVPTAKFVGLATGMSATKAERFSKTFNPAAVKATEEFDEDAE